MQLRLPDGKRATINNVYFPPQRSFFKRKINEEDAKVAITEVLTGAPVADYVITAGDFNARTGTLAPRVGDT